MDTNSKPVPTANGDTAPYWEGAMKGQLLLQTCDDCGSKTFLPRAVCPVCWSESRRFEPASGRGAIHAITTVHRAPLPAFAPDCPYVVAMVELAEGPRITMNVIGEGASGAKIGDQIEIVFEARGDMALPQAKLVRGIGQ